MGISVDEIAGSIEAFIREEFRIMPDDPDFSRDVHLFEYGYVDSPGIVELITFVESSFGVNLRDDHIFSERFTTINGISGVISWCLAEQSAGRLDGCRGA